LDCPQQLSGKKNTHTQGVLSATAASTRCQGKPLTTRIAKNTWHPETTADRNSQIPN